MVSVITSFLANDVICSFTAPDFVITATAKELVFATTTVDQIVGTIDVGFCTLSCQLVREVVRANEFIAVDKLIAAATV